MRWRLVVLVAGILLSAGCTTAPSGGASTGSTPVSSAPSTTTAPAVAPSPSPSAGISKVLVVVEENHSLAQMQRGMPSLYALAQQYGYATAYRAATHPSLPNYLALAGGSTFGVTDDAAPSAHPLTGPSVFGAAIAAGRSAKLYAESMPSPCDTRPSGAYAVKHAPWAYFVDEASACRTGWCPPGRRRAAPSRPT